MFITFEGLDFCGKSTQVKLLKNYLEKRGKSVALIREPGGTEISEKIRNILLDKENHEMFMESELLLFSASRAQLVREKIIPMLEDNVYVISDRFHDSSIAYQGFGRGIDLEGVKAIQRFAIQKAVPDITFFIDIPIEEMQYRRKNFGTANLDRIENSNDSFYQKVRDGYLTLAEEGGRFKVLDGTLPIEKLHELIVEKLSLIEKRTETK